MKRLLIILTVLVLLLSAVGTALLHTSLGLRVAAALLLDTENRVLEGLSGSILGGVRARRIGFEVEGTRVDIESVELPWELSLTEPFLDLKPGRIGSLVVRVPSDESAGATDAVEFELPMRLTSRNLVIDRAELLVNGESQWAGDRIRIQGTWHETRLTLDHLSWQDVGSYSVSGQVDTRAPHVHELRASILPDPDADPVNVGLSGTLDETDIQIEHPEFGAQGTLHDLWTSPRYEASVQVSMGPGDSLTGTIDGSLERFGLDANLDLSGNQIGIRGLQALIGSDSLTIEQASVAWPEGEARADVRGSVRYDGQTRLQGQWSLEASRWSAHLSSFSGILELDTDLVNHRLALSGRGSASDQAVHLEAMAEVEADQLSLPSLKLETSAGAAHLSGSARLDDPRSFQAEGTLAGLDLSLVKPTFESDLYAQLLVAGIWGDSGPTLDLKLDGLGGEFLGRSVSGEIQAAILDGQVQRLLASLNSGSSQVTIAVPDRHQQPWQVQATVQNLGDFWPDAHGQLQVDLQGRAPLDALDATGQFSGIDLAFEQVILESLAGEFDGRWDRQRPFVLTAQGEGLSVAGQGPLDAELRLEGNSDRATLTATTRSPHGSLMWDLELDPSQPERLQLQQMQWLGTDNAAWTLSDPLVLALDTGTLVWENELCLSRDTARLCTRHYPAGDYRLVAHQVPLALLQPYVLLATGSDMPLSGMLDGMAHYVDGDSPSITTRLGIEGLRVPSPHDPNTPILLDRLSLIAEGSDPMELVLTIQAGPSSASLEGSIHALTTDPRLDLLAEVDFPRIADALDLGGTSATAISGSLRGTVNLRGHPGSPQYQGRISGRQLTLPLPELGNAASAGQFDLDFQEDGNLAFQGRFQLKEGSVSWEGTGSIPATGRPTGVINIRSRDALLVDDPSLDLRADADLTLTAHPDRLELGGRVSVGESNIRLGPVESTVPLSRDVVYTDELQEEAQGSVLDLPLRTELEVIVATPVRVTGFGLDGRLDGRLTVFDGADEVTTALGDLSVSGRYRSYGQSLNISRGRLSYARTPLDNPALDIEATRTTPAGLVGVRVSGRVSEPDVQLFSAPAMDESEILSNLVLGQSLGNPGATTSGAVSAALIGLSATGINTPGSQLVQLDFNDDVGGAALRVGRFLSPKLYLDYTFGLLEQLDVLSLSYQLSPRWSVRTQVSTEVQTSINYQVETGHPEIENPPPGSE